MSVEHVTYEGACAALRDESACIYLDVRSVPEFEAGHVPGAYNVPLLHMGPGGMQPNPDFERVLMQAVTKDTPVVVGCKAGGRSARAAHMMVQLGYTRVLDYVGGWSGGNGDPGWVASGGETATAAMPGRSYRELIS